MQEYDTGTKQGLPRQPNEKIGHVGGAKYSRQITYSITIIVGHASFRFANGFHTSSASPVNVLVFAFVFGLVLPTSFSERVFSFFPFPLWPFLLCPWTRPSTPSASSAAALSSPRSAKPSRRLAARATRYRVLTRAGAGVRLGKLRAGEDEGWEVILLEQEGSESESDTALLVLPPLA